LPRCKHKTGEGSVREEIRLELQRKIVEKFEQALGPKPERPIMTLKEKAEILFNVALRRMR
jgi:hypothetical protein